MIRSARDKRVSVVACETRPYLQGARLTAWECMQEGTPCTLITDNMAGHLMSRNEVDLVIVGADRIAANGDTANGDTANGENHHRDTETRRRKS